MARVSVPLNISADEIASLTAKLTHTSNELRERINIVLACAREASNKKVAEQLNINEHTVAKWKKSYQEKGIEGLLTEHAGGRKATKTVEDLEGIIRALIENSDEQQTVKLLAEKAGVSEYQVSTVIKKCNLSLTRNHSWSYTTAESCQSADVEVLGIYLSAKESVVIAGYSPYGIKTEPGVMEYGNRDLSVKLSQQTQRLSRNDAIAESKYYTGESVKSGITDFVESYMSQENASDGTEETDRADGTCGTERKVTYGVFVCSDKQMKCRKPLPENVEVYNERSTKEWTARINSWMAQRTNAAKHYEIEQMTDVMTDYLSQSVQKEKTLPFVWQKRISATGAEGSPLTYLPYIPEAKASDKNTHVLQESDLQAFLKGLETNADSANEIQSGFIVFARGKNGMEYRTIVSNEQMPSADDFRFDSEDAFLNGMNKLERNIIRLRDEAGVAATDLYIEQVKKNRRP